MSKGVDLSIIIVSHRHEDMLPACLDSLRRAVEDVSAEIIVIDNLQDGAVARALEGRAVAVFENAEPAGFAANVNRGVRASAGRHVLLLNPDTTHHAGRLADALRFLGERPDVGVLGCRLLNPNGTLQQNHRQFPTLPVLLARGFGADRWPWRPHFYRRRLMENVRFEQPHPVDWVFGAFMLMRRADFLRLDGMDEGFRLYYEDVDLCRRFRAAGLSTCLYPQIEFMHAHLRDSAKQPLGQTWRWHVKSAARYFWKAMRS